MIKFRWFPLAIILSLVSSGLVALFSLLGSGEAKSVQPPPDTPASFPSVFSFESLKLLSILGSSVTTNECYQAG